MKGNHEPKIGKYYFKEKKQYLTSSNSKHFLKNNTNKTKVKNNNVNEFIIRKVEPKRSMNYTKINTYSKKFKYNNGLIKKSSYRKNIEPLYKSENLSAYDAPIKNLSSYKKLLDMMVEEYASNNENSKENINKLLKKSSEKNKNHKINLKKTKILSPPTKNYILNVNNNIIRSKPLYHTVDERNEKRKKEIINNKVIKIQSCFRGFFLRKIVERGIKKYYGIAFIFKLLEKIILKRKKRTFKLIIEKQSTLNNEGNQNTKNKSIKNDFLYTRKKYYNNNLYNDNSDKKTFSFSKHKKELEEINDYNKKSDNSKENKITKINCYNLRSQKNSKITQSMKEQRAPGYDLNSKILNNNYSSLTSSVIKKEKKMGNSNFNKKYQEKAQPINANTAYFFKKPIYKKNHSNRRRYIYIHKNINQKEEKNISSDKISSNISSNKNLNLNNENTISKFNHFNINNNALNNIYKYVILKIFKFIKTKFYKTFFQYFIYQLKIKRKVGQLKKFSFLNQIFMKINKKTLKKYLNIYREKVLTLQATELIGYNTTNTFNLKSIIKPNDSNTFKIESKKKEHSNNAIINHNKESNLKNGNKNNVKEYLLTDERKDLLIKLFGIKNKLIDQYKSIYFNKWRNYPNNIKSKNENVFKKNMQFNKNTLFKKYNILNNNKREKITVNKRQLRIKRINGENYSQNTEIKKNDTSKEKKMRIIKRISNPDEYLPLYNSYNKKLKNSNLFSSDIFLEEEANTVDKVYYIINKIEIKKLLFKFFTYWKKNRK